MKHTKRPGILEKLKDGIPNPLAARVCVVGAGSSGLVAIKELREQGHHVLCFEQSSLEGGIFSLGARNESDRTASAYQELEMNVSNHFLAFSSMPVLDESKRYWTHKEYVRYLRKFAERFQLFDNIEFNTEVCDAQRCANGKWEVEVLCKGTRRKEVFDALVVASGRYHNPHFPEIEGITQFEGEITHSNRYQKASAYANKKVVIIGLGESAADISRQLVGVAASVSIVAQCPPHITHRNLLPHTGMDDTHDALFSPFIFALEDYRYDDEHAQALRRNLAHTYLASAIPNIKNREARLVREWEDMNGGFPGGPLVNSDGFLKHVLSGEITVNFFGAKQIEQNAVVCGDDSKIDADVIIFCTGYLDSFPFLRNIATVSEFETKQRRLFKHLIHPDFGSSLAFIGMARPISGGVPVLAELQARYYAALLAKKIPLPDWKWIENDAEREQAYFYVAPEDQSLVVLHEYMIWLAREIGCLPTSGFWWRHPRLWKQYYFTTTSGSFFRLTGPGRQFALATQAINRQRPGVHGIGVAIFFILILKLWFECLLDRCFGHFLTRKIAAKNQLKQVPSVYLQRFFPGQQLTADFPLRQACENAIGWSNLKYRLAQYYALQPSCLHDGLTLQELDQLLAKAPD
jgi:cation diffusion facilitator CzcD-associated flavoprotein CzcO